MMDIKIGAVIVTYNRLDKLKNTIQSFENQTSKPDFMVVVDNNSTDGTDSYLKEWSTDQTNIKKYILTEDSNVGGSGGFHDGLELAMELDCDWVWISDDDACPEVDAFQRVHDYIKITDVSQIAAICTSVYDINGDLELLHRRRIEYGMFKVYQTCVDKKEYASESFELNAFSYVGAIVKKDALYAVGLTNRDYFIWFDDTEHSIRLNKYGNIICVPAIKVTHFDVPGNMEYDWKTYYGLRNMLDMYRSLMARRYYYYEVIYRWFKCCVLKVFGTKEYYQINRDGLIDGSKGKLGINSQYYPGWKPKTSRRWFFE